MTQFRHFACLLLMMAAMACASSQRPGGDRALSAQRVSGETWLEPPPIERIGQFYRTEIPKTSWLEVAATKLEPSLRELSGASWVSLGIAAAHFYGGDHLLCREGQSTYLIRAVYTFAETGDFFVMRDKDDVLVIHSALGSWPSEYHRAALLVCLPNPPSHVFVNAGVAQCERSGT